MKPRIGSVHRQGCPAGRHVHVLKLVFHLSSKVFRSKEFMNPFVELGDSGVVLSAETHMGGMNLMSRFAKKNGFSASAPSALAQLVAQQKAGVNPGQFPKTNGCHG
jgi:hypothetical protein